MTGEEICVKTNTKEEEEEEEEEKDALDRHLLRLEKINTLHEKYTTMDTRWRCCCVSTNKSLIQFMVETLLSIQIIVFCIVQMIRLPDCESQQLYSGILGLVIGILVPQPSIRRNIDLEDS